MKYSLRSLMTFSIRDLALVTVIVALVLGWGVDRWRLEQTIKSQSEELNVFKRKEAIEVFEAMADEGIREILKTVPDSSAPAPNPPKE